VGVIRHHLVRLGSSKAGLIAGQVELGQLDLGARVGVVGRDLEPVLQGGIGLAEGRQGFSQRHERVAVLMFGILRHHALEQGTGLDRPLLPQQALAKVRPRIDVRRVPLQRRPVAGLSLFQSALVEVDVSKLGVVVRLVQVMDLGLQLFDAPPVGGAGQLEAARGRGRRAIDRKVIKQGGETHPDQDEQRPEPFPAAQRIDEHPEHKERYQQEPGIPGPALGIGKTRYERGLHGPEINHAGRRWQWNSQPPH